LKNKFKFAFVSALFCLSLVQKSVVQVNAADYASTDDTIYTFLKKHNADKYSILKESELVDFKGNKFILYDLCPKGYAIFSKNDNAESFIEGSLESNSPYTNYTNEYDQAYYLGPTNYIVGKREDNDNVFNIFDNQSHDRKKYSDSEYNISTIQDSRKKSIVRDGMPEKATTTLKDFSLSSTPLYGKTVEDEDFTKIKYHEYFERLDDRAEFPTNLLGTCGLVANAILLAYYDTFADEGYVPSDFVYDGHFYDTEESLTTYTPTSDEYKPLINRGTETYYHYPPFTSPHTNWDTFPGASQALHNYLFDNCLHYSETLRLVLQGKYYPMTWADEESSVRDFITLQSSQYVKDNTEYISAMEFNGTTPKKIINTGNPVALVLPNGTNYTFDYLGNDTTQSTIGYHTVIGYGYDDNEFLTHFGWYDDYKHYHKVYISTSAVTGYFALQYKGTHINHSHNEILYDKTHSFVEYVCGCGKILPSLYANC